MSGIGTIRFIHAHSLKDCHISSVMRPSWGSLCQTVAVSIATILGTGILGLPVSLYRSGLQPFLLVFTFNLIAQLGAVALLSELLQRAFIHPPVHRASISDTKSSSSDRQSTSSDAHLPVLSTARDEAVPSLHSLASFYIPSSSLRFVFNFFVLAHFAFIMCSYALAAPQSYVALIPSLGIFPKYVQTSVFLIIGSSIVYMFTPAIIPPLSVAALTKGVILVVMVVTTFVRGLTIRNHSSSNWGFFSILDPFLMSVTALNGIVNLMPVTFQTCLQSFPTTSENLSNLVDHAFIFAYRSATIGALLICYVLNILWCMAVLYVVPQTSSSSGASSVVTTPVNATLEYANDLGLISTIPLMQVLSSTQSNLNIVIAFLVNFFISVSLTVSFLVMSVGTLHFLEGSVSDSTTTIGSFASRLSNSLPARYLATYAFILLVALQNPTGLMKILKGVTTVALNLEGGVFVVYMYHTCRKHLTTEQVTLSGSLSPAHAKTLTTCLFLYFSSTVLIDLIFYIPGTIYGR